MVGTGVFTTSGFLLQQLGARWAVLLVWALAGLLALAGAAVYGELGAMMPRVGGEYVYLSRLHPALGFLGGLHLADRRVRGADGGGRRGVLALPAGGLAGGAGTRRRGTRCWCWSPCCTRWTSAGWDGCRSGGRW